MDAYYADNDYNSSDYGNYAYYYDYEELEAKQETERMFQRLFLYIAPFLLLFGIPGNLFSFAVLQSAHFRKSPSSFILSALALTDVAMLLTGLLRHWIKAIVYEISDGVRELDIRALSEFSCRFHTFLTYLLTQLSAWTLVLMTIERLLSVTIPLTAGRVCSKPRMVIAWTIIGVCLAGVNCHLFKTVAIHDYSYVYNNVTYPDFACHYTLEGEHFIMNVWPWLDFLLACIIPAAIIIAINVAIVLKLADARSARQTKMKARMTEDEKKSRSLSIMLVGISVLFVVTTLPVTIFLIGNNHWPEDTTERHYSKRVAYALTNLLFYTNNTINFVIYCVTGARFRTAVLAMVCAGKYRAQRRFSSRKLSRMKASFSNSNSNSNAETETVHI